MADTASFLATDLQPAETLADAIYQFNPQKALEGPQLPVFYVDRGSKARRDLRILLETNDLARRDPIKLLFSGHTGSGKSTELNKLCEELGDRFFVVKVSTRQIVQPTDLTYVDIILIASMALFRLATDQKVIIQAPAQLLTDVWQDLNSFIQDRIFGHLPYRKPAETVELGARISYLVVEFETKYKNEATSREQIRNQIEDRLSEVIDKVNILAALVRSSTKRPVLFIFDDTDKPDPARGRQIFFEHPTALTSIQASIIYTFNISLWYSHEFNTFKDYFRRHFLLPNVKLKGRTGAIDADGWGIMREILARRISPSLISEEARQLMIASSGGLLRGVISLGQFAAVNALGRGATKIEVEDVERAVNELRNDFIAALESTDYAILAARHADKQLSGDGAMQELLQTLALLQYENGSAWCDIHPVVEALLQERTS